MTFFSQNKDKRNKYLGKKKKVFKETNTMKRVLLFFRRGKKKG